MIEVMFGDFIWEFLAFKNKCSDSQLCHSAFPSLHYIEFIHELKNLGNSKSVSK